MKWKLFLSFLIICLFLAGLRYAEANSADTSVVVLASVPGTPILTVNSSTQITATWSANGNPVGTEYYIENITNITNSGWITATSWISAGLLCATNYSFQVKARNSNLTETAFSSTASIFINACATSTPITTPSSSAGGNSNASILLLNSPSQTPTPTLTPSPSPNTPGNLKQIQQNLRTIAQNVQNVFDDIFHTSATGKNVQRPIVSPGQSAKTPAPTAQVIIKNGSLGPIYVFHFWATVWQFIQETAFAMLHIISFGKIPMK